MASTALAQSISAARSRSSERSTRSRSRAARCRRAASGCRGRRASRRRARAARSTAAGAAPRRGRCGPARRWRAEAAQPGAQLAGRAGGEGDGQQLTGRHRAGAHRVGDAVGDRAGLAGARAGEDADRAADRLGGGALLRVEPGQHALGCAVGRCHGRRSCQRRLDRPGNGAQSGGVSHNMSMTTPMMTMYTTTWCGFCARLKAQLARARASPSTRSTSSATSGRRVS